LAFPGLGVATIVCAGIVIVALAVFGAAALTGVKHTLARCFVTRIRGARLAVITGFGRALATAVGLAGVVESAQVVVGTGFSGVGLVSALSFRLIAHVIGAGIVVFTFGVFGARTSRCVILALPGCFVAAIERAVVVIVAILGLALTGAVVLTAVFQRAGVFVVTFLVFLNVIGALPRRYITHSLCAGCGVFAIVVCFASALGVVVAALPRLSFAAVLGALLIVVAGLGRALTNTSV